MTGLDGIAWPLSTARLTLRRAAAGDADAIYTYRSDPAVARYIGRLETDPKAWRHDWVTRRLLTALVVQHDGLVIGDMRLTVRDAFAQQEVAAVAARSEAELAWAFAPTHHRQGYAAEAAGALIDAAFGQLGLRRVYATCWVDNEPSWRLMERLGMRRESHLVRAALLRDGTWGDFLTYSLLAPGA